MSPGASVLWIAGRSPFRWLVVNKVSPWLSNKRSRTNRDSVEGDRDFRLRNAFSKKNFPRESTGGTVT